MLNLEVEEFSKTLITVVVWGGENIKSTYIVVNVKLWSDYNRYVLYDYYVTWKSYFEPWAKPCLRRGEVY